MLEAKGESSPGKVVIELGVDGVKSEEEGGVGDIVWEMLGGLKFGKLKKTPNTTTIEKKTVDVNRTFKYCRLTLHERPLNNAGHDEGRVGLCGVKFLSNSANTASCSLGGGALIGEEMLRRRNMTSTNKIDDDDNVYSFHLSHGGDYSVAQALLESGVPASIVSHATSSHNADGTPGEEGEDDFDEDTHMTLENLREQLTAAAERNDFQLCKHLKKLFGEVRMLGLECAQARREELYCVERENYDGAGIWRKKSEEAGGRRKALETREGIFSEGGVKIKIKPKARTPPTPPITNAGKESLPLSEPLRKFTLIDHRQSTNIMSGRSHRLTNITEGEIRRDLKSAGYDGGADFYGGIEECGVGEAGETFLYEGLGTYCIGCLLSEDVRVADTALSVINNHAVDIFSSERITNLKSERIVAEFILGILRQANAELASKVTFVKTIIDKCNLTAQHVQKSSTLGRTFLRRFLSYTVGALVADATKDSEGLNDILGGLIIEICENSWCGGRSFVCEALVGGGDSKNWVEICGGIFAARTIIGNVGCIPDTSISYPAALRMVRSALCHINGDVKREGGRLLSILLERKPMSYITTDRLREVSASWGMDEEGKDVIEEAIERQEKQLEEEQTRLMEEEAAKEAELVMLEAEKVKRAAQEVGERLEAEMKALHDEKQRAWESKKRGKKLFKYVGEMMIRVKSLEKFDSDEVHVAHEEKEEVTAEAMTIEREKEVKAEVNVEDFDPLVDSPRVDGKPEDFDPLGSDSEVDSPRPENTIAGGVTISGSDIKKKSDETLRANETDEERAERIKAERERMAALAKEQHDADKVENDQKMRDFDAKLEDEEKARKEEEKEAREKEKEENMKRDIARLRRFYEKYDKTKLKGVEKEVKQFAGRVDKLFEKLVSNDKYGPEPDFEENPELKVEAKKDLADKEEAEKEEADKEEAEKEEADKEKERAAEQLEKEKEQSVVPEKKKDEEKKKSEDRQADGKVIRRPRSNSIAEIRERYPSMGNVMAFNNEHNLIPTQAELDARVASGEQGLLMSKEEMDKMDKAPPKTDVKVKKKKGGGCSVS